MPSALVPLANITLSGSASTVTFSSISGSYRDLMLVVTGTKTGATATSIKLKFNSDSGANYNLVSMEGNGSSAVSYSEANRSDLPTSYGVAAIDSTNQMNLIVHLMDYSVTDKHKSVLTRWNNAGSGTGSLAARWASTSAIATILVFPALDSFAAGTTLALYGIASA